MPNIVSFNVYQINRVAVSPVKYGFGANSFVARPYVQGVDGTNTALYGIIEADMSGIRREYAVVETVAAIVAAAG